MSGFSSKQLKRLSRLPDPTQIYRRIRGGRELSYIPGWLAISEANALFGYSGWDRQTIELEKLFDRTSHEGTTCGYSARVRLVVRAGDTIVTREATGFGYGIARLMVDAHEIALKSAETDATKRALATFGNRFGLSLYGGTKSEPTPAINPKSDQPLQFTILGPDGTVLVSGLSPEAYASGLRQVIEKAASAEVIDGIISHNTQSLASLKNVPTLISRAGRHFSDILEELAASRKEKLSRTDRNTGETTILTRANDQSHQPKIRPLS